jgi:beta-galactosidase/beta-glucuronidase
MAAHAKLAEPTQRYPRPMLRRKHWMSLDGRWGFAIDRDGERRSPREVRFEDAIEVPFAPETPRSGVGDTGLYRACWYERTFDAPSIRPDEDLILHFGAVDYECEAWLDGQFLGRHEGGYTPFSFDLTPLVRPGTRHLVIRAEDDPADLAKPRGKQDWKLEPHSIWYPRTTGIWQTVWLERVPKARIQALRWTGCLERWEIGLEASVLTAGRRASLAVRLRSGETLLAEDRYAVVGGEVHRRIALSDPGIDDSRNDLLWSPSHPQLIDAELELLGERGEVLDEVRSYTALRSFAVDGGRFCLNGRPYPLRMVLDQGYWPETGLTPPNDAALRRDVELAKAMGFNAVRKHQKIEDPRYLYWADVLGLLVSEEMPSAYRFTGRSIDRLARQWAEAVARDASHPCVVLWVPFNESWGVPNLPSNRRERHYVQALYHLTKTLDPTRPVIGNDGWESVATDVLGIHDYEADPERLAARYRDHELLPRILLRERPGGRAIVLDHGSQGPERVPVLLSEFGGIALVGDGTWGYSVSSGARDLADRYTRLLEVVCSLELFAGFCYTQFADTYQEANGLLYADRTPKFPLREIAAATRGAADGGETSRDEITERVGAPH